MNAFRGKTAGAFKCRFYSEKIGNYCAKKTPQKQTFLQTITKTIIATSFIVLRYILRGGRKDKERNRETERQRDRGTERQIDRETERLRNGETQENLEREREREEGSE